MAEMVSDVPELLALWDAEKNEKPASAETARSYRAAWWKCNDGHAFQRSPRSLGATLACPMCGLSGTSLRDTNPLLAKRWHAKKNATMPDSVTASHTAPCWWTCDTAPTDDAHVFSRSPLQMVSDDSCPQCALASHSLAARYPQVAAEWHPHKNGDLKADQVEPDHKMTAWWLCSKSHEFQQTIRSRTTGSGRCPQCYGAWSVESIRAFVKSLLGHIDVFTPSEMFALAMQAGALRGRSSQAFVKALTTGRFPVTELEKFAEGEPSLVDEFAGDAELTLEIVEGRVFGKEARDADSQQIDGPPPDSFSTLPAAPDADYEDEVGEIDVSHEVEASGGPLEEGDALPVVQTREALAALDSAFIANADSETVKFLLDSAEAKLWRHAYQDPEEAEQQARQFEGDTYSTVVRDRFLEAFDAAESMVLPQGYSFRPTPKHDICKPHLMQRHVAVSVRRKRRFGNWSGMGAGKTLSAVLATRLVEAELTVICCPNAVVENWEKEILNAFPASRILSKTWTPEWPDPMSTSPRYLIMNFEQFQQPNSERELVEFLDRHSVDFVVIDEVHFAKQRDDTKMSKRKRLVQGMILEAGKKDADLCVLGMSGTPVINNLQEGRSLVEMITGHRHDDIETKATVQNCVRLYQRLVTLGTRWKPNYKTSLDEQKIEVDCLEHLDEIRAVAKSSVLEMEKALTKVRLPVILENLVPGEKALIYTHYVTEVASLLFQEVKAAGFRPGLFTGETDDSALRAFKDPHGNVDVLIASSRVSTGVDGIQHVCNKLIINSLPWTNAEYEQLRARVWRQGSTFDKVSVIIPVTYADVNGERWSYCESKLHRLEYKKSIADAAVDGVVPEGNLRTPAQAQQDIMGWLERLELGAIETIERRLIKIPLSREPAQERRRVERYGDFSKMNNRWYASGSDKTHTRLQANPEEWAHYHTMYQDLRKKWDVVPFQEEIRWLESREGLVVGDFGCGEALIAKAVSKRHQVHSFDHVAINDQVHACDIAAVDTLDDNSLDLAIFCLSLMGANFTDYIREAHRCLRIDGDLHIWEPASYFDDAKQFCSDLAKLGFEVLAPRQEGLFMRIRALKTDRVPAEGLVLSFRGQKA